MTVAMCRGSVPIATSFAHEAPSGTLVRVHPGEGWSHPDTSVAISLVLAKLPAEM